MLKNSSKKKSKTTKSKQPIVFDGGFSINGCSFHVNPKYQPIGQIGQGSYGVVCSVYNTETKEKLAIKKIKPMAGDEWDATHTLREIRLMKGLGRHENVIALKDLSMSEEKDELYLMMELVDTDLHRLLQSPTDLSPDHIRILMYQLLHGVKAMHEHGILHRDLKPGNLLVNKDCELKITDFGLARQIPASSSTSASTLTCENSSRRSTARDQTAVDLDASSALPSAPSSQMTEYVITRWYRPPELILSPNGKYNKPIDMWSVGCILGEMINRKPMFPGNDFMDQLKRIFQVCSIPSRDRREYRIEKDALKFLESLPVVTDVALKKKCRKGTPEALDLLSHLLRFNPSERYSVHEALAHPYFDGIEDDWGHIADLPQTQKDRAVFRFEFESKSFDLKALRELIKDEVHAIAKAEASGDASPEELIVDEQEEFNNLSINGNDEPASSSTTFSPSLLSSHFDYPATSGFQINGCHFHVSSKYKGLEFLGEGAHGIVCSAQNLETKEVVAIKKIAPLSQTKNPAHTQQILREIQLMQQFTNQPNIISLLDISTCLEHDEVYLITSKCDTDLHHLIRSKTVLNPLHIEAILYQLLSGIDAIHDSGVLHRDISPSNVCIDKTCRVLITDFGLSRELPSSSSAAPSTPLTEDLASTQWYQAPEIMLSSIGGQSATSAIDIWSIGCIMAELFQRTPLFPGRNVLDQLTRIFQILPFASSSSSSSSSFDFDFKMTPETQCFVQSLPKNTPSTAAAAFQHQCPSISKTGRNLLEQLLQINPNKRISAAKALEHPFFKRVKKSWKFPAVSPATSGVHQRMKDSTTTPSPKCATFREKILSEIDSFHHHQQQSSPAVPQQQSNNTPTKTLKAVAGDLVKSRVPTPVPQSKSTTNSPVEENNVRSADEKRKSSGYEPSTRRDPLEDSRQEQPQEQRQMSNNTKKQQNLSTSSRSTSPSQALPDGWECRKDPKGITYYVNHSSRVTSWSRPMNESATLTSSNNNIKNIL